MNCMNYHLVQSSRSERYPDVSGKPVRWHLLSGAHTEVRNKKSDKNQLKKLSLALSVALISACSNLYKQPHDTSADPDIQTVNCRYVQRDLSVAWDYRYYWCKNGHSEKRLKDVETTQKSHYKTDIKTARLSTYSAPQTIKTVFEPAKVFSDPAGFREPASKTWIDSPPSLDAHSRDEQQPAILESQPANTTVNQTSGQWQSVAVKIWFVKGLHVLGPKSTAKLISAAERLHPSKTIWLEGRLQSPELDRLSPDQARLLSVSRALSVRKALQNAGIKTEIRIRHPRLVATDRYVVLEQK